MDDDSDYTFAFDEEFHEIVSNKEDLKHTTEKFLDNVIDDITLGIIFDTHRKFKTKAFDLDRDYPDTEEIASNTSDNICGHTVKRTNENVICPNCARPVGASKFAPHLESCLGMGRVRPRNVRRVVNTNKDRDSTPYSGIASDDEDDADWDKRNKKKKDRNGGKKGKGTPKKNSENDCMDSVDVGGDEDSSSLASFKDALQDHSNAPSPADSTSSTQSKRREKTKSKKNHKRDKASPVINLNAD